jgi:hypothetical protein
VKAEAELPEDPGPGCGGQAFQKGDFQIQLSDIRRTQVGDHLLGRLGGNRLEYDGRALAGSKALHLMMDFEFFERK